MYKRAISTKFVLLLLACIGTVSLLGMDRKTRTMRPPSPVPEILATHDNDRNTFLRHVESFEKLIRTSNDVRAWKQDFLKLRLKYKRMETILEAFQPGAAERLNGPDLPTVDATDYGAHPPDDAEGLQVIEGLLWSDEADSSRLAILLQCERIRKTIAALPDRNAPNSIDERLVLEALQTGVLRMQTLGAAGFDTPFSRQAPAEMVVVLQSIERDLRAFGGWFPHDSLRPVFNSLRDAQAFLRNVSSADSLDAGSWIRNHMDPLYGKLVRLQSTGKIRWADSVGLYRRALSAGITSMFDEKFFDVHAFGADEWEVANPKGAALGRALFFDPRLSRTNQVSCATCHNPEQGFADGKRYSATLDGRDVLSRNTPGLSDVALQRNFFWDMRSPSLEQQMTHVVTSEKEFHTSYDEISRKLRTDSALVTRFRDAYPDWQGEAVNGALVMHSINLYLKTLVSRQSVFDRWIRRESEFYPEDARRGFNVFMGRGLCATCHFAPSFGGTVPPRWAKSESEVLGTWAEFDTLTPRLDPDVGRQGVTPAEHWRGSMKTPSLRNVALTAPYMHNGAFATLEQVMEFYERGGGAGVGLDVPHQTLPNSRLNLTESDKSDLIAFLKTLTDSSVLKR